MHKKFIYVLSLLLITSTFVACADSSNNMKANDMVTLSEINQIENYNIGDYDNLIFPESIKFKQVDKLYTFSVLTDGNNPEESASINVHAKEKMIELIEMYSKLEISESDIEFNTNYDANSTAIVTLHYFDSYNNITYTYAPNNSFTIERNDKSENDVHYGKCLSHSMIDDYTDIHLEKESESLSAVDAILLCNEYVADKVVNIIPENRLDPRSISLFKNNDGTYSYYIVYAKEYLGLNLSEASEYIHIDSGFVKPSYLSVQIDENGNIYKIMNNYSNIYDESSVHEINSLYIRLEDALGLLSNYLAKEKQYKVESVSMVYFLPTRIDKGSSKMSYTQYKPGYEVILESRFPSDANLYPRKTAYIDMQTGEIYICDSVDFEQYFGLG